MIGKPDTIPSSPGALIRIENFVDKAKKEIYFTIIIRAKEKYWDNIYRQLQILTLYIKNLKKLHSSMRLIIYVQCPDCMLALVPQPTLWPADRMAFIPNPTQRVVECEQCNEKKSLLDVFPAPTMLAHKESGKNQEYKYPICILLLF